MDKTETKQELETIEKQFGIQTHRTSGAVSKHPHNDAFPERLLGCEGRFQTVPVTAGSTRCFDEDRA